MKSLVVILVTTALSVQALARQDTPINTLIDAKRVETHKIYEAAERSTLSEALGAILQRKDPQIDLLFVFDHSEGIAGRIYALIGLHSIDKNLYAKCREKIKPNEMVRGQWYGRVRDMRAKEWIALVESGELYQNVVLDVTKLRSK